MDFTLSEEQRLFRQSVERFVADRYDFDRRTRVVATEAGYCGEDWRRFAELGWLAAPIPEKYGGLGCELGSEVGATGLNTMLLFEQFGRGLVMSPYLATAILGVQALLGSGDESRCRALLPKVVDGSLKLALAYAEPGSRYDLFDVTTRARRDGGGYRLDGDKCVVFYAPAADLYLVSARTTGDSREPTGISLFLVDPAAEGLAARPYATHDGGRASDLRLDNVYVGDDARIGEEGGALAALERAVDYASAAVCAEASGAMWAIYEQTLEYAKTRTQFGQTLGSFQSHQHRLVDVYMKCQLAQSIVIEASDRLGSDAATRARAVSAAKHKVGKYARDVGQEGIQLHGGVGMTNELPIGHYFKRITLINASFGDPIHHLRRYQSLAPGREEGAQSGSC